MGSFWRTFDVSAVATIALTVAVVGLSYGATASAAGFPPYAVVLVAALVFSASAEVLFVGVLAAGGGVPAAVVAGLAVGLRNAPYGVAAGRYVGSGPRAWLGAHLVNDESVALASRAGDPARGRATFWATGLALAVAWPLGAALGALVGSVVEDPAVLGLDAVFPALLAAMVLPVVRERRDVVVVAGAVALLVTPWLPVGLAPLVAVAATAPFVLRDARR